MEISAENLLPARRDVVWRMLNSPAILRHCIPGCEELTARDEHHMTAVVALKIGPITARFSGAVTLVDVVAPARYAIVGEGKGGLAGFAKGRADVELIETGDATKLVYRVDVAVGGKLAQLGSRLIQATSRKLSEEFFRRFAAQVPDFVGSASA